MSNFEERLLRRNTPGRWSELDASSGPAGPGLPMTKNSNAISSDANIEEDEYDYVRRKEEGSDSLAFDYDGSGDLVDIPETLQRQITGVGNRARPQLGPKGVLADYQAHKELEALERKVNIIHRHEILMRMAAGAKRVEDPPENNGNLSSKLKDNSDDDDDDDDAFMREYRNARMKELRAQAMLPTFHGCKNVNTSNFTDEINSEDSRVYVLVHLHDALLPASAKCQRYFEELSVKRRHWKFLEMKIADANIQIDKVALPLITIYKQGEIVEILAGITYDYLTDAFTGEDLDGLLDNTITASI